LVPKTRARQEIDKVASPKVNLYDSAYGNYTRELYRDVRVETYGEDFGQTSWVTTQESHEIPQLLELRAGGSVLELGCGSGGYALHLAMSYGCRVVGLDVNREGIRNANALAEQTKLSSLCRFEPCDISQKLPFAHDGFDAIFANDVLCHIAGRHSVLSECFRVLKPDGRLLFSDALIVAGLISHEEIATRSSIGYYLFSPPGENEKLIEHARFRLVRATDTTAAPASISKRWYEARAKRKADLALAEGDANFNGLQKFLLCVHTLTSERRLLRCLYLARK
jgi:ubiquinone/menaquinone biosynthesis C-methylase UbiE